MKPIPIASARAIATEFGFDQVVIIARAVGQGEHVTTFGKDAKNCAVAAHIGDFLKHKIMGWPEKDDVGEDQRYHAFTDAIRDILDVIDKPDVDRLKEIETIACRILLEAEGVLPDGVRRRQGL